MLRCGTMASIATSRVSGRTSGECTSRTSRSSVRAGSSLRSVQFALPNGLGRFPRRQPRNLRLDEAKLYRKAELDYVDYRNLNGIVQEDQETEPLDADLHNNGFSELDEDVEAIGTAESKKGLWQKLTGVRALFAYLTDRQERGKRGEGLFVLTVLVAAIVFFPPFVLRGCVKALGYLSVLYGAVSAIAGVASLGSSFSPFPVPRSDATFVTRGIFRFVRHPFYAGLLLIATGLTVISGNEFRLVVTALLYWIFDQTIKGEERDLEAAYPEYASYKTKTAKFIPLLY